MAQITARFRVVSRTAIGGGLNGQTDIVLRGTRQSDVANTENPILFRDEQSQKQEIALTIDRSKESSVFTVGKDVLVTFNGPT